MIIEITNIPRDKKVSNIRVDISFDDDSHEVHQPIVTTSKEPIIRSQKSIPAEMQDEEF